MGKGEGEGSDTQCHARPSLRLIQLRQAVEAVFDDNAYCSYART